MTTELAKPKNADKIEALAEKLFLINWKIIANVGSERNPKLATKKGLDSEVERLAKWSWEYAKKFYEVNK